MPAFLSLISNLARGPLCVLLVALLLPTSVFQFVRNRGLAHELNASLAARQDLSAALAAAKAEGALAQAALVQLKAKSEAQAERVKAAQKAPIANKPLTPAPAGCPEAVAWAKAPKTRRAVLEAWE